jgi:spore germination protein
MDKPKSVTFLQLAFSIGTTIIGVGILAFPRIAVDYVNTGAPFSALFAVLLMMCGGLALSYLGNQYPKYTLFEYSDRLIGKWLTRFFLVLIGIYFLELTALTAREFGEVVVTSVLQRTPISVTIFMMVIMAAIACRNDVAVFTRIQTLYMPLVYFPALVIVILSLKSGQVVNIKPVLAFFSGQSIGNVFKSTFVVAALFQNYLIVGLLIPFMYRPQRALKGLIIGMSTAGALYLILIYSTMSVFGIEEMKNLLWPTLELAKTAALPSFFLERLDPIFLAVWVTAVFTSIFAAYYIAVQAFSHLLMLNNHRPLSIIALPIIMIMAKQPSNIVVLYQIVAEVGMFGLLLTLGYPMLLLAVHWIKSGFRPKDASIRRRHSYKRV